MPKHKIEYDVLFETAIFNLRRFEYGDSGKFSQEHFELLQNQIERLMKRKKFLTDISIWKEIYERSICFYPLKKSIGQIPCGIITKHNYILRDFMKRNIHLTKDTLVHFDTHDDFNIVHDNIQLPYLYKEYLQNGDQTLIDKAQYIVHDIGAAVSGLLLTTGNRDNVWVVPNWIPDKNGELQYYFKENKRSITYATNDENFESWKGKLKETNFVQTNAKNVPEEEIFVYGKYQVTNNDKWSKNVRHLRDMIARNGETFILDIDLDFFVSNGDTMTNEYWEDSQDLKSDLRVQQTEVNIENPRNAFEKTDKFKKLEERMVQEAAAIDKRIKTFGKTLRYLQKHGLTPSLINICDSTNIEWVTDCYMCASTANNYMPKHLALFVHTKVIKLLEEVYASG